METTGFPDISRIDRIRDLVVPAASKCEVSMYVAITQDKVWHSEPGTTSENGGVGDIGLPDSYFAPKFAVSYSADGPGLAQVKHVDWEMASEMRTWLLGQTPCDFDIEFSATYLTASRREDDLLSYTVFTAGPIQTYRFTISDSDVNLVDSETIIDSRSGKINVSIGRESMMTGVACQAVYDVLEEKFTSQGELIESKNHPARKSWLGTVSLWGYPYVIPE